LISGWSHEADGWREIVKEAAAARRLPPRATGPAGTGLFLAIIGGGGPVNLLVFGLNCPEGAIV
jgi:hypothetical protein